MTLTAKQAADKIRDAQKVTFLTGAGVSTSSGIPDYRSLQGVYQGIEAPEYLLSRECMTAEPEKFYNFINCLYHPTAMPNVIHEKIVALEQQSNRIVWTVSQNIDGLHAKAGSRQLVNFHGSLYECSCRRCGSLVPWQDYLKSDRHQGCGGQLRPDIVLYGEGFTDEVLDRSIRAVRQADLLVVVGTTFQVHPFCDLIRYASVGAQIIAINQTPVSMPAEFEMVQCLGENVFALI